MSRIGNNLDLKDFSTHLLSKEFQASKKQTAKQGFEQLAETLQKQNGLRLVSVEAFKIAPPPSPADQAIQKIQEDFENRFAELAADPEKFHNMMKEVYGPNYNRAAAEAFRQKALAGDFSWLPKIEFQADETLQGGFGAYDTSCNVVYINEKFKNDPQKAAEVYSEEVGAYLDTQLNTKDTVGDEGEMFRRLLHGEKLTAEQKAEIRADDDHGVIYVNGKATEVEFWGFPNPIKIVSDGVKAVGNALSDGAQAVGNAVSGGVKAVGNALSDGFKALGKAISAGAGAVFGLAKSIGKAVVSGAKAVGKAVAKGAKAVAKAAKWVASKTWDGIKWVGEKAWDAAKWTVGAIKTAGKWFGERWLDGARSMTTGIEDAVNGAVRNVLEGAEKFTRGIGKIFNGKFGKGLEDMGKGLAKVFVQTPVDIVLMVGGRAVSAVQTQIGVEDPSRPLNEEEIKLLREVYGDSIDYSKVRIKEGPELFTAGADARTHGNVIHLKSNPSKALLIHEMGHVWQHQHGGNDYMSEALWSQAFGDGYNITAPVMNQTPWDQLGREQQAELLEQLYRRGLLPTKPSTIEPNNNPAITQDYANRILQEVKAGRGAA
jgi:hypothetical protein